MSLAASGMHKTAFRQAWFFTRQVGRGRSSQSHERERRRVRHFRPRRDGDGARVGVAQDREVGVAEEHLSRRRRRRRDARGPPAERARVRGRARRRRPLEISEPRRRRLGVAGDDAVRRVDDARARRGPPAAAEGRVGERRVEVAVVAPPAFFEFVVARPRRGRIFGSALLTRIEDSARWRVGCSQSDPGSREGIFFTPKLRAIPAVDDQRRAPLSSRGALQIIYKILERRRVLASQKMFVCCLT